MPNITNLSTNTSLIAKRNEVKGEIPNINKLTYYYCSYCC